MVIGFHYWLPARFFHTGQYGVSLFFVIGGLLMQRCCFVSR